MNNYTKVRYIFQSGFTLETKNHFLVFDYYKGNLNLENKNTTFFVSHGHEDHFNKNIFNYNKNYVLSYDIENIAESNNIKIMNPNEYLNFNGLKVTSFDSTDEGVAFLIQVDNLNVFHSGDLNWWAWNDQGREKELDREKNYKKEILKLKKLNMDIDIAFVPLDPRLGENYYLAGKFFIETIKPKYFFPMHFGDNFQYIEKFIHKMKDSTTHIVNIKDENQLTKLKFSNI